SLDPSVMRIKVNDMVIRSLNRNFCRCPEVFILECRNTTVIEVNHLISDKRNINVNFFDRHALGKKQHPLESVSSEWSFCHLDCNSDGLGVRQYRFHLIGVDGTKDFPYVVIGLCVLRNQLL